MGHGVMAPPGMIGWLEGLGEAELHHRDIGMRGGMGWDNRIIISTIVAILEE